MEKKRRSFFFGWGLGIDPTRHVFGFGGKNKKQKEKQKTKKKNKKKNKKKERPIDNENSVGTFTYHFCIGAWT